MQQRRVPRSRLKTARAVAPISLDCTRFRSDRSFRNWADPRLFRRCAPTSFIPIGARLEPSCPAKMCKYRPDYARICHRLVARFPQFDSIEPRLFSRLLPVRTRIAHRLRPRLPFDSDPIPPGFYPDDLSYFHIISHSSSDSTSILPRLRHVCPQIVRLLTRKHRRAGGLVKRKTRTIVR